MMKEMNKRQFVKNSAVGMSAVASSLELKDLTGAMTAQPGLGSTAPSEDKIGRPVRVVRIGFTEGRPLEEIAALVDSEGARGTDLIALPETFRGEDEKSQETLDGPTITTIARLAKKHRTHIVCPIDRKEGGRRVQLGRAARPQWGSDRHLQQTFSCLSGEVQKATRRLPG